MTALYIVTAWQSTSFWLTIKTRCAFWNFRNCLQNLSLNNPHYDASTNCSDLVCTLRNLVWETSSKPAVVDAAAAATATDAAKAHKLDKLLRNYHYNKMLFSITIKYIEKRGCGERKAARMCLTYRVWFKYTPNVTNDFSCPSEITQFIRFECGFLQRSTRNEASTSLAFTACIWAS